MKILGIDSSARSASAAITDGEKVLGCFYTNTGLTHSQTLMPMIESLLKNADDVRLASQTHRFQSAVGVCFEAMNAPEDQYIESAMLVPEYLRLPQAERELNKKLRKGE